MYLFVLSLHVLLCVLLVLIILLQPGKGGDVGAAFGGGGGSTMFGPRGPANLLSRATTAVAVLFMVTSVTLAWYSNEALMADADVESELRRLQREEREDRGRTAPEVVTPPAEAPGAGAIE